MARQPVKLLVIDPKSGYVSRFVDKRCTNVVHTEEPSRLGEIKPALELFRVHGPIVSPEAA